MSELLNEAGGADGDKYEVTGYDNKGSPQESIIQLQKAIDDGARIVWQGAGSPATAALLDFINKHNDRNPDDPVLLLNWAAPDVQFTNEKCSYWHFRFSSANDIKIGGVVGTIKTQPGIKKVYIINQDYASGQWSLAAFRDALKTARPDIQIVGEELHPLLRVTDFSPYIAKIRASGADTVFTSDWGQDIQLLLKAAADGGLQANWYAWYAGSTGVPTLMKRTGLAHKVFVIGEGYPNADSATMRDYETKFRAKYNEGMTFVVIVNGMRVLTQAINEAKSAAPAKVAAKLDGIKTTSIIGGDAFVRSQDHQFFQPLIMTTFGPLAQGEPFDEEGTGWGYHPISRIPADQTITTTTCKMPKRPS
jgi:branched-chain amino acid transport system substrate-binding protein